MDSQQFASNEPADVRARFERMLGENEGTMIRVANRLCRGDSDRAQDMVQDALLRAYQACLAGKFTWGWNERAWLLKILTNVFLNDCEKRKRTDSALDVDALIADDQAPVAALRTSDVDAPEGSLMTATLDEPLEAALARLSDDFRACVLLVDVEGLEYAEAAEALGIPIGTVRSRLARARLQLHALLYDYAKDIRKV
jgi:RNA polymerase sigma-70 factor (ECF subfamily)